MKPEKMADQQITIEVVYPLPEEQIIFRATVAEGSSLREGIVASGILAHYPQLVLDELSTGIFGKLTPSATPLRARDRIEIYRPLLADPKEVRKQRAAAGKRMKKGGGNEE